MPDGLTHCSWNETMNQFDGPEKKLEICIGKPIGDGRKRKGDTWRRVAGAGGAKIVGGISNSLLDAYILSESSLFVWDDRIVMITCGRTVLVEALPEILKFVDKEDVVLLSYERKNQLFPMSQPSSFEEDVESLGKLFPGKSFRLGAADRDHAHVFHYSREKASREQAADRGTTFELLMRDIDPSLVRTFSKEHAGTAARAETLSGISGIYPDMTRDDHLFSPCGYSLNAISGPLYFTIHVTPQKEGSYASFETNVPERNYDLLVSKITGIFKPRKFSVMATASIDKKGFDLHNAFDDCAAGYEAVEKCRCAFDEGSEAVFVNYVKPLDFKR